MKKTRCSICSRQINQGDELINCWFASKDIFISKEKIVDIVLKRRRRRRRRRCYFEYFHWDPFLFVVIDRNLNQDLVTKDAKEEEEGEGHKNYIKIINNGNVKNFTKHLFGVKFSRIRWNANFLLFSYIFFRFSFIFFSLLLLIH